MISLRLPIPPTLNHMYPSVGKRRVLSSAGQAFAHEVGWACRKQLGPRFITMDDRLQVIYTYHFPNSIRRDLANFEKGLSDSLVKCGVIADDSLIDHLTLIRGSVLANPMVEVEIREYP